MMAYKCDKCGKYFDWYEVAHYQKKFNDMSFREEQQWEKDNPNADFWNSNKCFVSANCIVLKSFDPINDNMASNDGKLSADINDVEDGNNPLIVLCANCMSDFLTSINYWDRH